MDFLCEKKCTGCVLLCIHYNIKHYMYALASQAFEPMQSGAAFSGPNRPAAVQLQHSQQLTDDSVVQGLRGALYSAITEIHSLKDENKALKEQTGLLENKQMVVSRLQEEVKQKDDLLKRVIKNR